MSNCKLPVYLFIAFYSTISTLLVYSNADSKPFLESNRYILDFVEKNGHIHAPLSFITFEQNNTAIRRMLHHLLSSTPFSKRAKYKSAHLLSPNLNYSKYSSLLNSDFIAVAASSHSLNWKSYLDMMAHSKVMRGLLLIMGEVKLEQEELLHDMLNNMSKNSMFYVVYYLKDTNKMLLWHRVITLEGYSKAIINKLKFYPTGEVIEEYDMHGTHLVSMTLSWAPYFTLYGCNELQMECNSEGYLTDVMNVLGEKMNFTWESHGEPENNWGTTAISGPSNSSGVWGGVVGDVFNGKYQLSIRY